MFTMAIAICNCNEAQCQCIFSQRRQEDLDLLTAMGHGSCLLGISESQKILRWKITRSSTSLGFVGLTNPRLRLRCGFGRGHDRLQRGGVDADESSSSAAFFSSSSPRAAAVVPQVCRPKFERPAGVGL